MATLLVAAYGLALTSCRSTSSTSLDEAAGRQWGVLAGQMMEELAGREPRMMTNVCTFYYRLHGRWPRSAAELAGTPLADGAPFDPRPFQPMKFEVQADGRLTLTYRPHGAALPSSPGLTGMTVTVDLPKPTGPTPTQPAGN